MATRTLKERLKSTKFIGFSFLCMVATLAVLFGTMSWQEWTAACGAFYLTFSGSNAVVSRAFAPRTTQQKEADEAGVRTE